MEFTSPSRLSGKKHYKLDYRGGKDYGQALELVEDNFFAIKIYYSSKENYFMYDFNFDGELDMLIISKGKIDSAEEAFLRRDVLDVLANEGSLSTKLDYIGLEKTGGEKPSNNYKAYLFDKDGGAKVFDFDEERYYYINKDQEIISNSKELFSNSLRIVSKYLLIEF